MSSKSNSHVQSVTGEATSPNDIDHDDTMSDDIEMQDQQSQQIKTRRGRKRTSKVWEVFEEVDVKENKCVVKKLKCKFCNTTYAKPEGGTTTHLKRHIHKCLSIRRKDSGQSSIASYSKENHDVLEFALLSHSSGSFDQIKIREILAKMIIVHEYRFSIIEHFWFNVLLKALNPNYEKVSRNTIKSDCLKVYETEKEKLKKLFKSVDRISLTSDLWTSNQTLGYMCLTAHFIDADWNLNKRIISFCDLEPPHTGIIIADAISERLLEWGLQDKVSTITLDNASSNDVVRSLIASLQSRDKLFFKGKIFHVRCCAHVLNLMVQDGLREIEVLISNIRNSVRYLKKSPSRLHKFSEVVRQMNVPTSKGLSLDVPTRWNSTFEMLSSALCYKDVFEQYSFRDANYKWLPSAADWVKAEKIIIFLGVFNDASIVFSGSTYPTSNLFLPEIWKVKEILYQNIFSEDEYMSYMANVMNGKFNKYWGDCNLLMSIAVILDPRYKMKFINFAFPYIYPEEEVSLHISIVRDAIYELFNIYAMEQSVGNLNTQGQMDSLASSTLISKGKQKTRAYEQFDEFIRMTESIQPIKSNLDSYLDEGVFYLTESTRESFCALTWWKANVLKYRTLSKMAKDVLSIPITTVASKSAFSAGGRVLDKYRSSLVPKTVDALVCTGNWIRHIISC